MRIGYCSAERFLGFFMQQAWLLRHTAQETNVEYVKDTIKIWTRLWNLNLKIEDMQYYYHHDDKVEDEEDDKDHQLLIDDEGQPKEKEIEGVNYAYLGNHIIIPASSRTILNVGPPRNRRENTLHQDCAASAMSAVPSKVKGTTAHPHPDRMGLG